MDILESQVCFEQNIKNSRFLAELIPCTSQNQAREIIKAQKKKYFDSSHVVHAFVIGNNCEILGMSDDGEPSGTAGRPVLEVLKGRNCTNVILTVTRWFGGTLLGTGGLVKAYTSSAKFVIEEADKKNLFFEFTERIHFEFECNYKIHKIIKITLEEFLIKDLNEEFLEKVKISGLVEKKIADKLIGKILDISNGEIKVKCY